MVEITDWDWKDPQKEMPKAILNEKLLGVPPRILVGEKETNTILVSHKVALIVEEYEFRYLVIARFNSASGWVFTEGNLPLSEVYEDYKVLQWAYLPKPKQEWEEKCEEDLERENMRWKNHAGLYASKTTYQKCSSDSNVARCLDLKTRSSVFLVTCS